MIRPAILNIGRQKINQVAHLALGDPSVIPLWYGESDIVTPDFVREAAKRALDDGKTFYDHSYGVKPLRNGLKAYLERLHGVALDLDRIIIPGSSMLCISMAVLMLVDPGDNVIVISPVWPNATLAIEARGGEARDVRLKEIGGVWQLDLAAVERAIDARTKAVFLASPSNPTGWIMPRAQQEALLDLARARGIAIIADEVYSRIVYDGAAAPSFVEIAHPDDQVFVINGFSKAWAMTGWRIGWMVVPGGLMPQMMTLCDINNTGASVFAQYGALAALEQGEDFLAQMVTRCRHGRDRVAARLGQLPNVRLNRPEGAFYSYFAIDGMTDSLAFAQSLVRKAHVGLAPGAAFGPGNETYLRLCYAQSPERLETGLERLVGALEAVAG